jgi:hypothetical protein
MSTWKCVWEYKIRLEKEVPLFVFSWVKWSLAITLANIDQIREQENQNPWEPDTAFSRFSSYLLDNC